jgi:transcriptional antiterminator NusG
VTGPESHDELESAEPAETISRGEASAPGSFVIDEMTADGGIVSDSASSVAPEAAPAKAKAKPKAEKPVLTGKIKKPAVEAPEVPANADWYILKVAFNREDTIRDSLEKRVKMEGLQEYFNSIVVPTEDVVEFTRAGKRRIVKRKLLPGYIMVNMVINDDTWFLVRETAGISDFTGASGAPMPMDPVDVERFINKPASQDDEDQPMKTAIPYRVGDRVRVKEGNFENQEGEVDSVDEANGRVTVIINIFGRSVPMELDHWQVEAM